jgi:arylsulfatase A-like enzyme
MMLLKTLVVYMRMVDRPNVVLISTGHWPAALLGSAGHPTIQTPTLDALAQSGTRFKNAYREGQPPNRECG